MATSLKKLGFNVVLKTNAAKGDMGKAIEDFGKRLKGGDVGLFYYAGHGVQVNGVNYLIPVGAKINDDTDVEYEALDAGRVLSQMYNAKSRVNIVMLDACRDNPYFQRYRSASRGLAIIAKPPSGTIISYSTSPGDVALDGKGRNSPYTSALLQYMKESGLTIEQVFKNVRQKIDTDTAGKQTPWELSSLKGEFYFVPKKAGHVTEMPAPKMLPIEEKDTEQIAISERPSVITVGEKGRDGRFIAYDDGTVLDTQTNLMWAAKDNGGDINWVNAKSYCENYRGGGYTDWRMPTQEELEGLYDKGKGYNPACAARGETENVYLTNLITLSCWYAWTSKTRGTDAAYYIRFINGSPNWYSKTYDGGYRALPVRSGKKEEALLAEKTALEEKQRQLAEKKKQLAIVEKQPFVSAANEIRRDGRFIAYDNGTVLDTSTNLMWASKDNGNNINWADARSYCENYRGGGYKDWRMPTQNELAGLYDENKSRPVACYPKYNIHVATELIDMTCFAPWASETRGIGAADFGFDSGGRAMIHKETTSDARALPVRSIAVSKPTETGRDERFVAYSDGTVLDTKTNLMWAAKDNGYNINWQDAKSYCENYRGGSYKDWRMPKKDEVEGLYDARKTYQSECRGLFGGTFAILLTELIHLTCDVVWAMDTSGSGSAHVGLGHGARLWTHPSFSYNLRALPVRSIK
jgi:hypothetical protein